MPTGRRWSARVTPARRITTAAAGAASGRRGGRPGTPRPGRKCAAPGTGARGARSAGGSAVGEMAFVHLHTHSEYSLLDGANRIPDLLDHVQALGMDALAITDHGNLHGAWQFYVEAKARKIRPILGFEAYLAFGSRQRREVRLEPEDRPYLAG